MNHFHSSTEMQWMFKNAVDWKTILSHHQNSKENEWGSTEEAIDFISDMIGTIAQWSDEKIAPRARELDEKGPGEVQYGKIIPNSLLSELYSEAVELGFFEICTEKKFGGLDLPIAVQAFAFIAISRGCLASTGQLHFFTSIIDMLERFGSPEDQKRIIPQILAGKLSGCMALTEPGAGSDLGLIRTRAVRQADGNYLLTGNKIFITNGSGGVCFVLGRIVGAPEGLAGLSLFMVEQNGERPMNYRVAKRESKMGLRGSPTCELVFENSYAKLVGEEHQGLSLMFHLMNQSRLGLGTQTLGLMDACLEYVREYSQVRKQFGKPIAELPLFKRNFKDIETEVNAFRAYFMDSLNSFSAYYRLDLKKRQTGDLNESETKQFTKALKEVRKRTPLIKYYGTEAAVDISKKCIQALGGYGFMKEFPVERWHRDSFAPLLYEGTSQIQALMVLKDLIKDIVKNPGDFMTSVVSRHSANAEFLRLQSQFRRGLAKLMFKTLRPQGLKDYFNSKNWMQSDKVEKMMVHAETVCQGLAYLETLKALSKHRQKDPTRAPLFLDYYKLIHPRMMAILDDWKLR